MAPADRAAPETESLRDERTEPPRTDMPVDLPATASAETPPLLHVHDLHITFGRGRDRVDAVRGVDLTLRRGECLAVVGESGSGKSATARALVGLAGPTADVRAARLELDGRDLTRASERELRRVRGGRIGFILQDALVSLDPLRRVGAEIGEVLANHGIGTRSDRADRVVRLLADVSVPEPELRARQFPHQLSGGLRQRALIATGVAADPDVLIADEPTTALDVTVQAQILDLLAERKARGIAVLLISHDLAVVARLADRIAVMYDGVIVEDGPAERLLAAPAHPYTRHLLAAVPGARGKGVRLSVPAPTRVAQAPKGGCAYAPRCPLATAQCAEVPPSTEVGDGHSARCFRTGVELPAPAPAAVPQPRTEESGTVLEVTGVAKAFTGPDGVSRPAVDDVSFTLRAGETLGVLGESGSGKSTLAAMTLGLLRPEAGSVRLLGEPWSERRESERTALRGRIQLVQQDPLSSFDPRWTVERIVAEALGPPSRRALARHRDRVHELLDLVGLDARTVAGRRPRALSGGQRQRVAIARALAPDPRVLVCDEPVSALDVSVQAQILDLFQDLRDRLGVALLFISHDLGVIQHVSDRVLVMQAGRAVESGPADEVFAHPREPYTQRLLAAVPTLRHAAA